jgi:hypothetical protein
MKPGIGNVRWDEWVQLSVGFLAAAVGGMQGSIAHFSVGFAVWVSFAANGYFSFIS